MIRKIFILIFAVLILSVSCEDDNPVDSSKNQKTLKIVKITPGKCLRGDNIVILAENLVSGIENNKIYFGAIEVYPDSLGPADAPIQIYCRVPDSAKTCFVSVNSGGSIDTSDTELIIIQTPAEAPEISKIEPMEGNPGSKVTIYGKNFIDDKDFMQVAFGSYEADIDSVIITESEERIIVTVPSPTAGTIEKKSDRAQGEFNNISVQVGSKSTIFEEKFKMLLINPLVTGFYPVAGYKGDTVTVYGDRFGKDSSLTDVYFGDVQAEIISVNDSIRVIVPEIKANCKIKVIVAYEETVSAEEFELITTDFSIVFASTQIRRGQDFYISCSGIDSRASKIRAFIGAAELEITGIDLQGAPQKLYVICPDNAVTDTIKVQVYDNMLKYKYPTKILVPKIKYFTPGHLQPGDEFSISIINFLNKGTPIVKFGDEELELISFNFPSVTAKAPNIIGKNKISVKIGHIYAESEDSLTIHQHNILSFEPQKSRWGRQVRINGDNFGTDVSAIRVYIGDVEAEIVDIDNETIDFIVPHGAVSGPIKVSVDGYIDISEEEIEIYPSEYLFTKFTLSIENVLVQKYEYYHSAYPPDYESHSSENYDTLIKTFNYTVDMNEKDQNNYGDTISYSFPYGDPTSDYVDCIINKKNKTISNLKYFNYETWASGLHDGGENDSRFNISMLEYIISNNIIEAYVNGNEVFEIIEQLDVIMKDHGHYSEQKTRYTLLNTTDSSRIVLTLEMAE